MAFKTKDLDGKLREILVMDVDLVRTKEGGHKDIEDSCVINAIWADSGKGLTPDELLELNCDTETAEAIIKMEFDKEKSK